MGYLKEKLNLGSITRKILVAFILAFAAIFVAFSIARFSFVEMKTTVDQLSSPNEKLSLLNSLFKEITTLDQLQRAEAITNPRKPYNSFLDQSKTLNALIDSLGSMQWDSTQVNRLVTMKEILNERNKLFFSYLKVKANLLDNRQFSVQLDTLAAILDNDQLAIDSSIVTTGKRTITTYLPDTINVAKKDQRSFIKKLFSKRKEAISVDTPKIKVEEQYSVHVDTISVARQNEALLEVERIMRELEKDQRSQRKKLQQQELDLVNANGLFITQLLNILQEVENEELAQMHHNNEHAITVMNQSISRIDIIMIAFCLAAALLVYLIYLDVSRSNFYKKQLEKARDEAQELSQIKQRFLANMSHEIRTPLQSIIGFAEHLKQSGNDREAIHAIHSSSEHLLHIVNEVLDYSRISSGTFVLAEEKFKLLEVIREVESAMRIQAARKNLTFILDFEKASAHTLCGDAFRLRQILYNLLGNAIKFTHKGFVKLSVKTIDKGGLVECIFQVTDTGIGMTNEELKKVFNQFEQASTDITRQYGGTGLGLTIVKSLVDFQGGKLDVSSRVGAGSTFTIGLDYKKENEGALQKTNERKTLTSSTFKGKVLVVDDDNLILRLCSIILTKNKIDHVTFSDALKSFQYDPEKDFTHIFLDIRMPEINGIDLCKMLKEKYPNAVIVALTAHVLPEERLSLLQEGFDEILTKPFHEPELIEVLTHTYKIENHHKLPDLSRLKAMTLGDEALFQSIVAQFVDETTEDLLKVRQYISQHSTKSVREVVHKLSGRMGQMGIMDLSSKFHELEEKLVAGITLKDIVSDLEQYVNESEVLIKELKASILEHS